MASSSSVKKCLGRQKMPMKLIENVNNRVVTFSKRRAGLAKKISELCTLCGVKALLIIFSPAGRIYSLGHPSVDALIYRYINELNQDTNLLDNQSLGNLENVKKLNVVLTTIREEVERMKKKTAALLDMRKKISQDKLIYIASVETLPIPELEHHRGLLSILLQNVLISRNTIRAFLSNQNQNQTPSQVPYDPSWTIDPTGFGMQPYNGNFSYFDTPNIHEPFGTLVNANFINPNISQPCNNLMNTGFDNPNILQPSNTFESVDFNNPNILQSFNTLENEGFNNPNILQPSNNLENASFNNQNILQPCNTLENAGFINQNILQPSVTLENVGFNYPNILQPTNTLMNGGYNNQNILQPSNNVMNEGCNNQNILQPIEGNANPNLGPFDGLWAGVNPTVGSHQDFAQYLLGADEETLPIFNPQHGSGFGLGLRGPN